MQVVRSSNQELVSGMSTTDLERDRQDVVNRKWQAELSGFMDDTFTSQASCNPIIPAATTFQDPSYCVSMRRLNIA